MPLHDRDELLSRTNLADLITEICGTPQGRGRGAKWHCANPEHPDLHPSMGIYDNGREHRWKCHACGAGGTAIDLLMIVGSVSAGEAMQDLALRAGISPSTAPPPGARPSPRPSRADVTQPLPRVRPVAPEPVTTPHPAIEEFVTAAEHLLWAPGAGLARRTLEHRGFSEPVLRANRVGFDPGPSVLPRPEGLPHRSPGIVFPVLDQATNRAVYYQVRTLSPRTAAHRKYDQPTTDLAPNPKLAALRTAQPATTDLLAITEGIPDGLTTAQAGLPSLAILGVAHAAADNVDQLAQRILRDHPAPAYAVCFDPDPVGTAAGTRLAGHLAHHGATVANLRPPHGHRDLNTWWQADSTTLVRELTSTPAVLALGS